MRALWCRRLVWQAEGEDIAARRDGKILFSIQHEGDRACGDEVTGVHVPQSLAVLEVEDADLAELFGGKQDPARCRQKPRSIMVRPDLGYVPYALSRDGI